LTIGIFGNKARNTAAEKRHYGKPKATRGAPPKDILLNLSDAREAMGIDWMTMAELAQAIPPAYSEYLASKLPRKSCCVRDEIYRPIGDNFGHSPTCHKRSGREE
jgi:hypothetical protein